MRSQLFIDYGPSMLPLSSAIKINSDSRSPAEDPPWQPHPSMPGYKIRHFRNGRMEIEAPEDTPAAVVTRKEPPYCPPDWGGFQYHGADGKADEVVRPAPATCTALASPAASAVETTEHGAGAVQPDDWQSGAPPVAGWYEVYNRAIGGAKRWFAFWFGDGWSYFGEEHDEDRQADIERGPYHRLSVLRHRGPRLIGPDWPEPEAKAEEVPSVTDLSAAFHKAHSRNKARTWDLYMAADWSIHSCPPHKRAAAIAAFDAIRAA